MLRDLWTSAFVFVATFFLLVLTHKSLEHTKQTKEEQFKEEKEQPRNIASLHHNKMAPNISSTVLRTRANEQLNASRACSGIRKKTHLESAFRDYNKAASNGSLEEKALSMKNLAVAYSDMAHILLDDLKHLAPVESSAARKTETSGSTGKSSLKQVKDTRQNLVHYTGLVFSCTEQALRVADAIVDDAQDDDEETVPILWEEGSGLRWNAWKLNVAATAAVFASEIASSLLQSSVPSTYDSLLYHIAFDPKVALKKLPDAHFVLCHEIIQYLSSQVEELLVGEGSIDDVSAITSSCGDLHRAILEAGVARNGLSITQESLLLLRKGFTEEDELHKALSVCVDADSDFPIIESEVLYLMARAESRAALQQGDYCLTKSTDVTPARVWAAIDLYHEAVVKARSLDLEMEAKACSRLGRCFTNYLPHNKVKGKNYYRQAMALVLATENRSACDQADWFVEAKRVVEEFQQRIMMNDDEKQRSEAEPYLRKLRDVLKEIEKLAKAAKPEDLLEHIYEKHPPKKTSHKLDTSVHVSSQLRNALIHYHPDKNSKHGKEWEVLCEEIYKHVNSLYADRK